MLSTYASTPASALDPSIRKDRACSFLFTGPFINPPRPHPLPLRLPLPLCNFEDTATRRADLPDDYIHPPALPRRSPRSSLRFIAPVRLTIFDGPFFSPRDATYWCSLPSPSALSCAYLHGRSVSFENPNLQVLMYSNIPP